MKQLSGSIILDTKSKIGIEFASLVSVTNRYNVPIAPNCRGDWGEYGEIRQIIGKKDDVAERIQIMTLATRILVLIVLLSCCVTTKYNF